MDDENDGWRQDLDWLLGTGLAVFHDVRGDVSYPNAPRTTTAQRSGPNLLGLAVLGLAVWFVLK